MSYLANSNTEEIHDLNNTKDGCELEKIKEDHKIPLATLTEVIYYIDNKGYNGCFHCLNKYHTD